ncbi:hypothetical protein GYMLUDRAFT_244799 [Collybiopsis luxurians FD-317 M1]|uniref:N-acetyltransferase domain-containing protein n=1 Tax=Collybiopsis luxurians FD-317 M1 TaxID=944289 RepID=A0A0D0CC10_9AGAR|nr:hypothetical protein GYMLUDRAFT_244799 [Collybiopsis luxurians FD-317 M1]
MFQTKRLRLRELRSSDLLLVQQMFNNYEFQESGGLDYTVPRGNEFTERWSGWAKSCLLFTIIEEKESNEFVGFTSLNMPIAKNRDADFTIGITQSQWGKGYGTEATQWVVDYGFKALNLHRISLSVTATNARAISLYKYVGFAEEGRKKAGKWSNGQWVDQVMMGIVEEDWAARIPDQTES